MTDDELSAMLVTIVNDGAATPLKAVRGLMAMIFARAPEGTGRKVLTNLLDLAEKDAAEGPPTMQ